MKKKIVILSIIFLTINQIVYCQNFKTLKNLTLGEIIELEKKELKNFVNKTEYSEINVYNFNFSDFSYSTESIKKDNTFYKLFFYNDTIKKILFFDKEYSEKNPVYGTDVCYTGKYKLFFVYNVYFDWKINNYAGFIISDNKEKLNIFFGYKYESSCNNVYDIDRIFILDSNFVTKKQLLIKKGVLRYITEPVKENHEYKYEKSLKCNKYIKITKKTKLNYVLRLTDVELDTLDYKILYLNGLGMYGKKTFCRRLYPLWSKSRILYYPCMVIHNDEKKNKVYYRQIVNGDTIINKVIDEKIRGELECFDWIY